MQAPLKGANFFGKNFWMPGKKPEIEANYNKERKT
jgi:hypothetical protein